MQFTLTLTFGVVLGVVAATPVFAAVPAYQRLLWIGSGVTADKNYPQILAGELGQKQGQPPALLTIGEASSTLASTLSLAGRMTDFHADLAVVHMGENDRDVTVAGFQKPYEAIIRAIRAGNPRVHILCTSAGGPPGSSLEKVALIQATCRNEHTQFVSLAANGTAVNRHPGNGVVPAEVDSLWSALEHPDAVALYTAAEPDGQIMVKATDLSYRPEVFFDPEDHSRVSAVWLPDVVWTDLPVNLIRGRWIALSTRIREGVSETASGESDALRFQLYCRDLDGRDQTLEWNPPPPTADWTSLQWRIRVPDKLTRVTLALRASSDYGGIWAFPIQITDGATELTPTDLEHARSDLKQLAEREITGPITRYAVMCEFGLGGPKDLKTAEYYLRASVARSDAAAMYFLANLLLQQGRVDHGQETERDIMLWLYAARLSGFSLAAEQLKPPLDPILPARPAGGISLGPDHDPLPYFRPEPHYPPALRYLGIGGEVVTEISVGRDGTVTDASIVYSPLPEFEAPALSAVKKWRFVPGAKGGVPIDFKVRTNVVFRPQDSPG